MTKIKINITIFIIEDIKYKKYSRINNLLKSLSIHDYDYNNHEKCIYKFLNQSLQDSRISIGKILKNDFQKNNNNKFYFILQNISQYCLFVQNPNELIKWINTVENVCHFENFDSVSDSDLSSPNEKRIIIGNYYFIEKWLLNSNQMVEIDSKNNININNKNSIVGKLNLKSEHLEYPYFELANNWSIVTKKNNNKNLYLRNNLSKKEPILVYLTNQLNDSNYKYLTEMLFPQLKFPDKISSFVEEKYMNKFKSIVFSILILILFGIFLKMILKSSKSRKLTLKEKNEVQKMNDKSEQE